MDLGTQPMSNGLLLELVIMVITTELSRIREFTKLEKPMMIILDQLNMI